jgi:hypothetical protein
MYPDMTRVEELQSLYSDFHKEVYGFRPRTMSLANWNSESWLDSVIADLHAGLENRKDSFAGRETMREEGWHVPETEPELIRQAEWLKQERARERAEWEVTYNV